MIQETIITSLGKNGYVHISPMGVHVDDDHYIIMPFRPSTTLDHILATRHAVMNHTDDVRVFAGCLTGRRDWPLTDTVVVNGKRLENCLSHQELELVYVENDHQRPKLYCKIVHQQTHLPFKGFNRAQFAVLEAAILVSRLSMLPLQKINSELEYLEIAINKCAGERELEAWEWLMQAVDQFRREHRH
ncbi:MAG TPA: DUF447 family protein [Crenotrichaceae bacterium]|nr:DUF447 family protein [Crenotrichaceae bacterium]